MKYLLLLAACSTPSTPTITKKTTPITFEVDHVAARSPNTASLNRLTARLEELRTQGALSRDIGAVTQDDELPANAESNHAYSMSELDALVTQHKDSMADAYFLYVDGHFEEDTSTSKVLGFAYGGDRIVMFADTIKAACERPLFGASVCELAEASTLIHEFGHLLGLVNNGVSMVTPHQDTEHGAHDVSDKCIMHWTINQASHVDVIANALGGGGDAILPFDAACIADLKAAI